MLPLYLCTWYSYILQSPLFLRHLSLTFSSIRPHGSTPRFLFGGAVFLPAMRFIISTIQKPVIGVMPQWIKRPRAELSCLWMQALALVRRLSYLTKFG